MHARVAFSQSVFGFAIIGIVLGSIYAGRIYRRFIKIETIAFTGLALAILLAILVTLKSELSVVIFILMYGFFSGILCVPLNALLQLHAKQANLGRILAANIK